MDGSQQEMHSIKLKIQKPRVNEIFRMQEIFTSVFFQAEFF